MSTDNGKGNAVGNMEDQDEGTSSGAGNMPSGSQNDQNLQNPEPRNMSTDNGKGNAAGDMEDQDEGTSSGAGNLPSGGRQVLIPQNPKRRQGTGYFDVSKLRAMSLGARSPIPRLQVDQRQIIQHLTPSSSPVQPLPSPTSTQAVEESSSDTLSVNALGYPIGVNNCEYYITTGSCPYGSQCQNTHPDFPTAADPPLVESPSSSSPMISKAVLRQIIDEMLSRCWGETGIYPEPVDPPNQHMFIQHPHMQRPAAPANPVNQIWPPSYGHNIDPNLHQQYFLSFPHDQHASPPHRSRGRTQSGRGQARSPGSSRGGTQSGRRHARNPHGSRDGG